MKRVTGIGGVFFKCQDPDRMKDWYRDHLGFNTDKYGTTFVWHELGRPNDKAYTQWSPFDAKTTYFQPSEKQFMLNYRVADLEGLLKVLKEEGVEIVGEMQTFDYGKFAHIMDPEGNKIELWEPVDQVFTDSEDTRTTH
ncbi:VOC family protein [Pontibacter sp. G13]|uniref:VOC family protein n=1 Tax=Pontibacter sp. G13 TaxID=3074898 RepID=UPI0028890E1E|nr:VOC family protein [Pontibacter sp. G13]WNJ19740.1 VOC family protein [Pontibacter sp. G13]